MIRSAFLVTFNKKSRTKAYEEAKELISRNTFSNTSVIQPSSLVINYEIEIKKDVERVKKGQCKIIPLKNVSNIILIENISGQDALVIFERLGWAGFNMKYVHRIVPIQKIGVLEEVLACLLAEFGRLNQKIGATYKISYKQRMSSLDCKKQIFDLITKNMKLAVNLTSPDYIFLVEIVKGLVGYTVMPGKHTKS